MRELQDRAERLQRQNDRLWTQVEERRNLGKKDVQDSSQARNPTIRDKEKKPVILDNIDTPTDDELSSSSSPNLSPEKSNKARSCQRHSHRLAFSNIDNGLLKSGKGRNKPRAEQAKHSA